MRITNAGGETLAPTPAASAAAPKHSAGSNASQLDYGSNRGGGAASATYSTRSKFTTNKQNDEYDRVESSTTNGDYMKSFSGIMGKKYSVKYLDSKYLKKIM